MYEDGEVETGVIPCKREHRSRPRNQTSRRDNREMVQQAEQIRNDWHLVPGRHYNRVTHWECRMKVHFAGSCPMSDGNRSDRAMPVCFARVASIEIRQRPYMEH